MVWCGGVCCGMVGLVLILKNVLQDHLKCISKILLGSIEIGNTFVSSLC